MTEDKKLAVQGVRKIGESRSPMQDAIREFRRNKIAVTGMLFVLFVILVAIFASRIALWPER